MGAWIAWVIGTVVVMVLGVIAWHSDTAYDWREARSWDRYYRRSMRHHEQVQRSASWDGWDSLVYGPPAQVPQPPVKARSVIGDPPMSTAPVIDGQWL